MNKNIFPILIAMILVLICLSACGTSRQAAPLGTISENTIGKAAESILSYDPDAGITDLTAYFADGKIPEAVNILYDQMGSNPDITITDPETIAELYNLLSKVEVIGETETSVTDCYHHIQFKLGEDQIIVFSFESSEIWYRGQKSYALQNSSALFRYMQELTEAYCRQMDNES